jgi:signal transduction histidine kinase
MNTCTQSTRKMPSRATPGAAARTLKAERDRIGRELHDGVAQCFMGISLQAASAYEHIHDAEQLRDALEKIHLLAKEGMAEARVLALGLTAPAVRTLGLVGALQLLAHKMTATKRLLDDKLLRSFRLRGGGLASPLSEFWRDGARSY